MASPGTSGDQYNDTLLILHVLICGLVSDDGGLGVLEQADNYPALLLKRNSPTVYVIYCDSVFWIFIQHVILLKLLDY